MCVLSETFISTKTMGADENYFKGLFQDLPRLSYHRQLLGAESPSDLWHACWCGEETVWCP